MIVIHTIERYAILETKEENNVCVMYIVIFTSPKLI